jgi:hypothetical protein
VDGLCSFVGGTRHVTPQVPLLRALSAGGHGPGLAGSDAGSAGPAGECHVTEAPQISSVTRQALALQMSTARRALARPRAEAAHGEGHDDSDAGVSNGAD